MLFLSEVSLRGSGVGLNRSGMVIRLSCSPIAFSSSDINAAFEPDEIFDESNKLEGLGCEGPPDASYDVSLELEATFFPFTTVVLETVVVDDIDHEFKDENSWK